MTEEGQPQPAWRRALDGRTPGWCPEAGVHWESWSLNGEACITGLDPPFAGGARVASCLTWLVRSFASHCRRTHDATGAFAVTCTGRRMPSTLALTMSGAFDLALRDPRLIRERVRRRGGDPAACCWPAFWLEGAVYDYVIGRDPFPPVGTRRRKLVVLAEERQVFVPARAATLAAGVHRAWARGLDAVAGVDGAALTGLLDEDEDAFLLNMLVLVHARPAAKAQPRPPLDESYRRHEGLIAELAPSAQATGLPVAWHALWRLPPAMTWSEPGGSRGYGTRRSRSWRRCDRCRRQIDMSAREQLRVRVNDELVLDAGTCEEVCGPHGPRRLIRPPETTLFHQVLDYLKAKPDPPKRPSGSMVGREGVAAAAVAVRWGSYLAVLLDHDKPLWPEVQSPGTSRISDEEMARINIEASAALAEWIDLHRADRGGPLYEQLVNRAVAYMPMPKKTSKLTVTEFGALAQPERAARIVGLADAARLERVRGDVERHPSRVLANALLNTAWRNGPVENLHAGELRACPLDQRRVTPAEERELMVFVSERLALGMTVCLQFTMEQPRRRWLEQVLPYGLAEMLLVTPSRWTLTEATREIRLPA